MPSQTPDAIDPLLPLEALSYRTTLVPVIQQLLIQGLPPQIVSSSVRLRDFTVFTGGLKAPLVGGLRIDLKLALKVGDPELEDHAAMMRAVNDTRARTFPRVLHVGHLEDGRVFLLMEEFVGFAPLLARVYEAATEPKQLERLVDKAVEAVLAVHASGHDALPVSSDPYTARIVGKLERTLASLPHPQARALRDGPGLLVPSEGAPLPCPGWRALRSALEAGLPGGWEPTPLHGDPHLANVMVRRYGASGWSARLIDPNCTVGRSDPLYDLGKLLHWAEPVGWTQVRGWAGDARIEPGEPWVLHEHRNPCSAAAEARRHLVETRLLDALPRFAPAGSPDSARRLRIAVASAHAGLADLLVTRLEREPPEGHPALQARLRFVLFHALRCLAAGLTG